MHRYLKLTLIAALGALGGAIAGVGCGSAVAPIACSGGCTCTGTSCTCASGQSCSLDALDGGGTPPSNVSFDCSQHNTCSLACSTNCTANCAANTVCSGSCGSNCNYSCNGTSTCGNAGDGGYVNVGTDS